MIRLADAARFPFHLLWVFAAYALFSWHYSVPLTGDEKVYVSTAMEMWERGEWIRPYLMGQTSYFKPPFQYWATLAGWSVFGFNLVGTFLPQALSVVGTAWFLSRISILLGQERSRVTAGLWFAGCMGTLTYGTSVQMEIWIVFFYSAAWWLGLRFSQTGRSAPLHLAFIVAGLSSLVKSPLYAVFWVLGFWLFLALQGQLARELRRARFYLAHLLGIAAGLSWFIAVYRLDPERFWNMYVIQETLGKRGAPSAPLGRMWLDFLTFLIPFALLLIPAFAGFRRSRWAFVASSVLLPALFFSSFPYKTETYLYILLPTLCLILDWGLASKQSEGSALLKAISRLNGVLLLLAALAASALLYFGRVIPAWVACALVGAGIAQLLPAWKARVRGIGLSFVLLVFVIRLGILSLGENDIQGLRQAVQDEPGRRVVFLDEGANIWHELGLHSVAIGRPGERAPDSETFKKAIREGALGVCDEEQGRKISGELRDEIQRQGKVLVSRSWSRWKRGFSAPGLEELRSLEEPGSPKWEEKYRRSFTLLWVK